MSEQEEIESPWNVAQKRCWSHIETATQIMRVLETLKPIGVASVIPILADNCPTIMITPIDSGDLVHVRAVCRLIKDALHGENWEHMSINDEWVFRLKFSNITIDVMTRLTSVQQTTITL